MTELNKKRLDNSYEVYYRFLETEDENEFFAIFAKIDSYLENGIILKNSRSVFVSLCDFRGKKIIVKRYNDRGFAHRAKYLIKTPRALNAIKTYFYLTDEVPELKIPRHIAAILSRNLKNGKSYLIQEAVENAIPTHDIYKKMIPDEKLRGVYIEKIAAAVASLHKGNVRHGDCKLSNIYFQNDRETYSCGIWDLDVAKIASQLSTRARVRDLGRLTASFLSIGKELGMDFFPVRQAAEMFLNAYNKYSNVSLTGRQVVNFVKSFQRKKHK